MVLLLVFVSSNFLLGNNALMTACDVGDLPVVQEILDNGARVGLFGFKFANVSFR